MTRRNCIASLLALPFGLVTAAKPLAATPGLNLDTIFEQLYRIKRNRDTTLIMPWFQAPRIESCSSIEYLDQLDVCFGVPEGERRVNWCERRKERSRQNMLALKKQRPLPLP